MQNNKGFRYLTRFGFWSLVVLIAFFSSAGMAAAADVSASNISGKPDDTVTLFIDINEPVTNMTDWGLDIYFDTNVLEYASVDKTETLSAPLTANGRAQPFGARVGAFSTGESSTGQAGTLLKVNLNVKSTAYKNSPIELRNFVDYIEGATTVDASFTIDVTVTVNLSPPSVDNVVAGQPVTLTAQVLINGTPLELTDPDDVAFVTSGTGAFGAKSVVGGDVVVDYTTPVLIQTATITATEQVTGGNRTGTATVTSIAGPLATLTVAPDTATLTADQTQQFTATGVDSNGNPVTELGTITWSVNGGIGAISTGGLFDATTVGTGSVTATSSLGPADTTGDISVTAGALATLVIDPNTATLTADDTQTFTVSGRDADGNSAVFGDITWSVNGGIGTIDATGLFDATTVGTGSVTATSSLGPALTSGDITVTPGAAASILLASDREKIASQGKGAPAQLTATVRDADGNTKTDLPATQITFTVSGATEYAAWTSQDDETESGIASVEFNSAGNEVGSPATVNIVASGASLTSNSVPIEIVDFSATADVYALVTSGTPNQATLTAVGAENYTWSIVSGPGSLSAASGEVVTFTAPPTIAGGTSGDPTVIRVADASDAGVNFPLTITTYNPVAVTWPTAAAGIALGDATKIVTASGGTGAYEFESSDTNVATVAADGTITPVAAGTITVKVKDATYGDFAVANGFLAVTPNIEIVQPIVLDPQEVALLALETQQFAAAGGKGESEATNYTWSVNNVGAGSINANGLFTAANVTEAQTAIITATDKTYTNITGTAIVDVYPTLTIKLPDGYDPEDPATWPLVLPGETYDFEVLGGEGTLYTWTVEGPVEVEGGVGETFTFEAPTEGPFAGVYAVTVTDDETDKTFSINVKVPMTITPANLAMLGDSTLMYPLDDPFLVRGAPEGTGIEVSLVTTAEEPADIANPDEYGEILADEAFGMQSAAEFDFVPADITGAYKSFLFKVQAIEGGNAVPLEVNGGTPLKDAGLDVLYSGVMLIFPVAEFEGYVVDERDNPLDGVEVRALLGSKVVFEGLTDGDGYFSFKVADPASSGQQYLVGFVTDGFVAQVVSTQGWVNPETIVLVEAVPGQSITGLVIDDDTSDPIPGALVETTVGGQALSTYTALDGSYVLNFSVEGTWNYATSDNFAEGEGCEANEDESGTLTIEKSGTGYILKVLTDEGLIQFTGTLAGGVYTFTQTSGDETTIVTFSLIDPSTGVGTVDWSLEGCIGGANLDLTRELGEGGVLLARASKLGYLAVEQNVLTAPDFYLTPLTPGAQQEICEDGGAFEWEGAVVEIPAGALDGCYIVEVNGNIPVTPDDDNILYTQKSVVLVEISIAGAPMPLAKPIGVTIPFDRDEVEPGDFKAGRAVIYHAPTAADLRAGANLKVVPTSDILVQDDFNGLVTFRVSSLSVFGVGGAQPGPGPGPAPPVGGGSSGGCFIGSISTDGPVYPAWLALLIFLILVPKKWIRRRGSK